MPWPRPRSYAGRRGGASFGAHRARSQRLPGRPSPNGIARPPSAGRTGTATSSTSPVPERGLVPVAVAFHRRAEEQQRRIRFRGTEWQDTRVSRVGVTAPY